MLNLIKVLLGVLGYHEGSLLVVEFSLFGCKEHWIAKNLCSLVGIHGDSSSPSADILSRSCINLFHFFMIFYFELHLPVLIADQLS